MYCSPTVICLVKPTKNDKVGGESSTHGEKRICMNGFGRKTDGKGSLGRYRRGWENNNKMDLKVIGWVCLQWIHLARGRNQ